MMLKELIETENIALASRRYDLSPNLVHKLIKAFQKLKSIRHKTS